MPQICGETLWIRVWECVPIYVARLFHTEQVFIYYIYRWMTSSGLANTHTIYYYYYNTQCVHNELIHSGFLTYACVRIHIHMRWCECCPKLWTISTDFEYTYWASEKSLGRKNAMIRFSIKYFCSFYCKKYFFVFYFDFFVVDK